MTDLNRPKVVMWFKVFCYLFAISGLLSILASIPLLAVDPEELVEIDTRIPGTLFLVTGLVTLIVSLPGIFLKPRPWVWSYNLILICLGILLSWLFLICIPLLLFWFRGETKSYYGKDSPKTQINL